MGLLAAMPNSAPKNREPATNSVMAVAVVPRRMLDSFWVLLSMAVMKMFSLRFASPAWVSTLPSRFGFASTSAWGGGGVLGAGGVSARSAAMNARRRNLEAMEGETVTKLKSVYSIRSGACINFSVNKLRWHAPCPALHP